MTDGITPPRGYVHRLERKELTVAAMAGVMRRIDNLYANTGARHGAPDAWNVDIDGCIGEMLVARFLNQYWAPGHWTSGDILRGIEVRSTRWRDGCLLLHHDDADTKPYVLVTLEGPSGRIRGWLLGREGKQPDHWRTDAREPAFFVPQSRLRDPDELIRFLDDPTFADSLLEGTNAS